MRINVYVFLYFYKNLYAQKIITQRGGWLCDLSLWSIVITYLRFSIHYTSNEHKLLESKRLSYKNCVQMERGLWYCLVKNVDPHLYQDKRLIYVFITPTVE